jgi:hypothetical protein
MTKGLKEIADELNTRLRWGKTDEKPPQQFVALEGFEITEGTSGHIFQPAIGTGKDMRAAAEDLARVLRGQTVIRTATVTTDSPERHTLPLEINPRQYK